MEVYIYGGIYIYIYVYIYIYMYVYMYICIYVYLYMCVCVCVCVCVCMCACVLGVTCSKKFGYIGKIPFLLFLIIIFFYTSFSRWDIHLYMSLFPFVRPSVRRAPYLRNHTSCDHNVWYTCVKWWYIQTFFFSVYKFWFFRLLGE